MILEKILGFLGIQGLFVLKVKSRTGFVAESLIEGKLICVNLKIYVSLLSDISIFTYEGEIPLKEVMQFIAKKEKNGQAISHKEDNTTLSAYFKEILPDFDEERVYPSDIKKVLNWYNTLQAKGLVTDLAPAPAETAEKTPVAEEKPKKTPAAKKSKAKKEE